MADFSFNDVIRQESGGRQFDKTGAPLRSSKGATGIAQIMPATGPEAAKDAGLPWDPQRLENDPAYNRALGEAYHAKLAKRFGSDIAASAAYNGGPGRFANALQQSGGDVLGAVALMPQETRDYVSRVHGIRIPGSSRSGGMATGSSGPSVPLPPSPPAGIDHSWLDSVISAGNGSPSPAVVDPSASTITGANRFPVANPRDLGPAMKAGAQEVAGAIHKQDDFIDQMTTALGQVQADRRARTETAVAQKQVINQTLSAETQSMMDRVKPVMDMRTRLAAQMEKLATMNPLERGLRGIFDLNYNEHYLREQVQRTDDVLGMVGKDYEYVTNLQGRLHTYIDQANADASSLDNLTLQDLDEKGKLVATSLQAAHAKFSFVGDIANQQESLIRARQSAADQILTQMAPADVSAAMNRAQHSPSGTTVVDGVELSFGELRQRTVGLQSQEMALRSQRVAVERGEGDLADYHAGKWAESATETQLRAAVEHGGVVNGMKIPMPILSQQLAVRENIKGQQTEDVLKGNQTMLLSRDLTSLQSRLLLVNSRAKSLYGAEEPPEIRMAAEAIDRELTPMMGQMKDAQRRGVLNDVSGKLRARVQELTNMFQQSVEKVAERHAAGDKGAQAWVSTYLNGGKLDANQSADALYYYTQHGGLPTGMRASPQARAAFSAAQSAQTDVDNSIRQQGIRVNQQQRKEMIMRRIQETVPRNYTAIGFNDIISAIPHLAQQTGDEFAKVRPEDFNMARRQSEVVPYQEIARTLGVTPDIAQQVMAGSYKGADAAKLAKIVESQQLRGKLVARQQAVFLDTLDRSPSAKPGFRPSDALAKFLNRPEVMNTATQYERMAGTASYGDFLGGSMAAGQLPERMSQWSKTIQQQTLDNRAAEINSSRMSNAEYNVNPIKRAQVVLAAIPGINSQEEQRLLSAIQHNVPQGMGGRMSANGNQNDDTLGAWIKGVKFHDPGLERIRKIAAQHWDQFSAATDRAIDAHTQAGVVDSVRGDAVTNAIFRP